MQSPCEYLFGSVWMHSADRSDGSIGSGVVQPVSGSHCSLVQGSPSSQLMAPLRLLHSPASHESNVQTL